MHITQQRWVILVIAFTGLAFSVGLAPPDSKPNSIASRDVRMRKIEFGKSLVKDQPEERFVDWAFADLPRRLKSQMDSKLHFILQWDAHPQFKGGWEKLENATVRVIAAGQAGEVDLVEYRWQFRGQNWRAVAAMEAMRLDIQLDEAKNNPQLDQYGPGELDRVKGLLSSAVRLTETAPSNAYEVKLPWPTELVDGVSFSSNPEVPIGAFGVYQWPTRVDGYVHDRTLSLLFYMRFSRRVYLSDGSKWFSDEFRARVQEAARVKAEQAKAPKPGA